MKTRILIKAIVILLLSITGTYAQDPILKKSAVSRSANGTFINATNNTSVSGYVMDKDGNRYMSGRYIGTNDFDPGAGTVNYTSTNTGASAGYDLFITKLDKNDNLIWIKVIGTAGNNEFVRNMAVDANGNVIVTGVFREDMDFDPGSGTFTLSNGTTPTDFKSLFMLKLDANGGFLWAKNFQANTTGGLVVSVDDMNVDAQNNIFCSGYFYGDIDFDPSAGTATVSAPSNAQNGYFFKLDASGNYVFHKQYGTSYFFNGSTSTIQQEFGRSSAADASGNVYSLWTFRDFTGLTYTVLDKYSATGTLLGFYRTSLLTTTSPTYLKTVLDKLGNVFISANRSVVKINTASMNSTTTSATALWTKPIVGFNIGIDNNNNIIKTGNFSAAEDFDPGTPYYTITPLNSFADALISKMDNDGNFIYAKGLGASGNSNSNAGVSRQNITSYGDIQIWGYFDNSIDVDPSVGTTTLTNTTGASNPGFWATYSLPCTGSPNSSSVTVSACGSYYWATKAVTYTTSGTYTETLTNVAGCDSIITLNLTVNPLPSISLSNNNGTNLTCANPNTTVTASGASTYAWTGTGGFTATTAAATITAAGTYIVTGTSTTGCTATASVVITEDKTPPPNITFNYSRTTINCTNPTANINAFSSGSTFSWTGPSGFTASTSSATVSTGGIYTVTATGTNGCTATANSQNIISDKTVPTVTITPISAVLTCTNPSASFTASGANTYSWSGPATANSGATITGLINAGTYSVVGTNSTNGCTASASVTVTADKVVPTVSLTPTSAVLTCTNSPLILTAGGNGVSFVWSRVAGGYTATTPTATVTSAGEYRVTATGANGCTAMSGNANITANITPPSFTLSPADPVNLTCTNPSISVSAPPGSLTGVAFSWTGPLGFTSTSSSISPNVVGTYAIIATGTNGCTTSLNRTVNSINKTPPTITVTPSSAALTCTNPSVSLTASGVSSNTTGWSGPGGYSNSGATVNINTAGTYIVSGMSSTNGCTATTSVVITDNKTPPVITITPSSSVLTCANPSQNLTASGGVSYVWTRSGGGFTATTPSITVTTPDLYFATGTGANGCTSLGNINVTQNITAPSSGLSYATTVLTCTNPSIPVTASVGASYAWTGTGGFTATTAIVNISIIGTYVVIITGSNGCAATRSVAITENKTLPTVSVTPTFPTNGNLGCTNSFVTLTLSSNGVTYDWSKVGGGFTATGVSSINVNTPGTYNITVSAANGCTASASSIVTQNISPPPVVINPASVALSCTTPTTTLTASEGNTYSWTGPVGFASTSAAINIIYPGTYTVTATGTNNCTATTNILVINNLTPPVISVTPTNTVLDCASPSLTLTASGGSTYAWTSTGGFTATSASLNISTAGTYAVTATNIHGCTASVSRVITGNTTPITLSVTPTSAALNCITPSTTLTATASGGGTTYAWTGTGGFTANTASANISNGGIYIVTATGSNNCTATASVIISENRTLPMVSVTPTSANLTCSNPSVTLVANGSSGVSYSWSLAGDVFTATTASVTVTAGGTYTVRVTSTNGCTATANVVVTGGNLVPPVVTITPNPANAIITCTNPYIVLNANIQNSYSWSGPGGFTSTTGSVSPSVAGVYALTATALNGCTATANITLIANNASPTVTITPTTTVLSCTNPTLVLTASGSGNSSYSWRSDTFAGSIVNPTLTITTAGSFSLQATADNGCRSSVILFTITENKTPPTIAVTPTSAVLTCTNLSTTLTASGDSYQYSWNGPNGFTSTATSATISNPGTYVVTGTRSNGCTASASVMITNNIGTVPNPPTISPTGTITLCSPATSVILTASGCTGGTITWNTSPASTGTSITVTQAGLYSATCTTACGTSPVSATTTVSTVCSCLLNTSLATGNWSNATNWSCGHIPLVTEPVQISTGHTVTLDINGTAKSLDLRGILNKQATKILNIQGN